MYNEGSSDPPLHIFTKGSTDTPLDIFTEDHQVLPWILLLGGSSGTTLDTHTELSSGTPLDTFTEDHQLYKYKYVDISRVPKSCFLVMFSLKPRYIL
jgi:hypothetical protein